MENANEKGKETGIESQNIKKFVIEILTSFLDQNIDLGEIKTNLTQRLKSILKEDGDYDELKEIIMETRSKLIQFSGILKQSEDLIIQILEEGEKKEKFDEAWWNDSKAKLKSLVVDNIDKAFDFWMQLYCETLVEGRLDLCLRLSQEDYEFLNKFKLGRNYFEVGTVALKDEDYEQALNMLEYLANNGLKFQTNESINLSYALLNIFIGRYYLYEDTNYKEAKLHFDKALSLSPEDGRSYAGLGSFYLEKGDYEEATKNFSLATEKSPNQPEGYIGRGLIFESQEKMNEAEEEYDKAINHIADDEDIVNRLNMLLAKGSASLFIQVARFIQEKMDMNYQNQALNAIELALNLAEENSENQRESYKIKGDILNKSELHNESALAYYEAGRRYYWDGKFDIAEELFYKVQRINERLVENYWYLTDVLRIQAYKTNYPFVKEKIIKDALKIWDIGFNIEKPKISWPYVSRAWISDRLAQIEEEDRNIQYWEEVAYLECALTFSDVHITFWSQLMSSYINLELEPGAIQLMLINIKEGESNVSFLESQAVLLSNIGEYQEALRVIEKRALIEEQPWNVAIKGYNNFYLKAYDKALHLFEDAIEEDPTLNYRQWIPFHCAMSYRILGLNSKAKNKFYEIWKYIEDRKDDYIKYSQYDDMIEILFYLDGLKHLDENISQENFLDQIIKLANDKLNNIYKTKESIFTSNLFLGFAHLKKFNFREANKFLNEALKNIKTRGLIDYTTELILELEQQLFESLEREGIELNKMTQKNYQNAQEELVKFQSQLEDRIGFFDHLSIRSEDESKRIKHLIEDLENRIERFRKEGKTEGYAWIGLNATLVRWYEYMKEWSDKLYDAYNVLHKNQKMFPVINQKLKSILNNLRDSAKIHLEEEDLGEALNLFERALNFIKLSGKESMDYVEVLSCIGFIYFKTNRKEKAIETWKQAIMIYHQVKKGDDGSFDEKDIQPIPIAKIIGPGRFIGGVCLSLLKKIDDCWSLINFIEEYVTTLVAENSYLSEFNDFKKRLFDFFNQYYHLKKEDSTSLISVVTPIVVEIGSGLIPEDDNDWDFLRPEEGTAVKMRERIKEHMNIKIPGIRIRGNEDDFSPGDYEIKLDEIPIVKSSVNPNMGYCLKPPEEIRRIFPEFSLYDFEVADPITGKIGCWIPKEYWDRLDDNNFEYWKDPMIFIARHLEAVLYQNLGIFLGIQEVESLLDDWEEENDDNYYLRESILPNPESQVIFARILQNLVIEEVPITNLDEIFEIVRSVNLKVENIDMIIRKIRLELKTQLPGNDKNVEYRYIGPLEEYEDILDEILKNTTDKTTPTIPPETISDLLSILRDIVDYDEKNQVLVIEQIELRKLASDIAHLEFPYLIVIAKEELI